MSSLLIGLSTVGVLVLGQAAKMPSSLPETKLPTNPAQLLNLQKELERTRPTKQERRNKRYMVAKDRLEGGWTGRRSPLS
jgi:hypothetical protein